MFFFKKNVIIHFDFKFVKFSLNIFFLSQSRSLKVEGIVFCSFSNKAYIFCFFVPLLLYQFCCLNLEFLGYVWAILSPARSYLTVQKEKKKICMYYIFITLLVVVLVKYPVRTIWFCCYIVLSYHAS